jgi:DNA polymerase delta subunit 1
MSCPKHVITDCSIVCQRLGSKERKKYLLLLQPSDHPTINSFDDTEVITCKTEMELIDMIAKIVNEYDPDIISGYNIFGFDYPYLQARLDMYNKRWPSMGRLLDDNTFMKVKRWESSAYGHQELHTLQMSGRISIDLLPIFRRDYKLDKYDLNTVSNEFLGRGKHDMDAPTMFKAYEEFSQGVSTDLKLRVSKYCDEDSVLVLDLIERTNVWVGLLEMSSVVGVGLMDIFTRGQQIRCLSQLYDVARNKGVVLDKRLTIPEKYVGGYVGEPRAGLYEFVMCLDFSSLYPSIIRAYNICYTTLVPPELQDIIPDEDCHILEWEEDMVEDKAAEDVEDKDEEKVELPTIKRKFKYKFYKNVQGLVPYLCEVLTDERKKVRGQMKKYCDSHGSLLSDISDEDKVTYNVLDKRQLALKVSNNSIYGAMGASNGMIPLLEGAMATTAMGRMLLLKVNEYIKSKYEGACIVYNDTDSTMITLPFVTSNKECIEWGLKLEKEVSALFPSPLYMEFEKGGRMLCIKKKKYSYWLIDTKTFEYKRTKTGEPALMNKGIVLARRDNCKWQRRIFNQVLIMIMTGKSREEVHNVIVDEIISSYRGDIPYSQLSVIRSIGANYKNPNYFMAKFKEQLRLRGNPLQPGDRIYYIIVKGDGILGSKMRTIPWYLEDKERIDMDYYIEKAATNCIQQLYNVGYGVELEDKKLEYYNRDWNRLFGDVHSKYPDLLQPIFNISCTYEEAYEHLCNTKGLITWIKRLKSYYIPRYPKHPSRITSTPIRDLHRTLKLKSCVIDQINMYGSSLLEHLRHQ